MTIPEKHLEFCRALAAVAKQFDVTEFSATFTPGFNDPWHHKINMSWEQGRHGEDNEKLSVASQVYVRTTISGSPETGR
jgi:hypothetical protein